MVLRDQQVSRNARCTWSGGAYFPGCLFRLCLRRGRHYYAAHASLNVLPPPKIPQSSVRTVPYIYIAGTIVYPSFTLFPVACDPAVPCTQGQQTTAKHATHNHFPGDCGRQSRVPRPTHMLGRSVGRSIHSVSSSSPPLYPDAVAGGPERQGVLRCMRGGSPLLLGKHIPLPAQVRRARSVLPGGIVGAVTSSGRVLWRTCRT